MTTVIYHRADFDGLFCREIACKFLGTTNANYIGWDYGDPVPDVSTEHQLYILDLSVPELMDHPKLIWIDHHKTAIDRYSPDIPGYRIDGVAACRLAWQWFSRGWKTLDGLAYIPLPDKQAYVDRTVNEPLAVRLAGEYDIWDKRDSNAELFQHGLRSRELTTIWWAQLLRIWNADGSVANEAVNELLARGEAVQFAKLHENESIIQHQSYTLKWEGLTFLACNHARFNSHLFTAGLTDEHDACLGFCYDGGKKAWKVSLYHAPGKEHHDLSEIARRHGGGGHRGACGFMLSKIDSLLPQ